MVSVEVAVVVIAILIAVIGVGVVVWWNYSKRQQEVASAPEQPFSLFDVRIHDLETRLERVKVELRVLNL